MLQQQLSNAWRFRERAFPINPVLTLKPEGLVLGAGRQIAAAGGRPIRWYFAEAETAAHARELFKGAGGGRENIDIEVLPWPGKRQ